jgi:hypothetical protein
MYQRRKTRIVCISDTHNQTPKLPPGDVLIHAGDLTNQGSYSELKRTVEWIEKQDFEAKIVIAGTPRCCAPNFERNERADTRGKGNHDITLDGPFFRENEASWKWPSPQDTQACRKLLMESKSITYLENEFTEVLLQRRGTRFTVFGSPCTPKQKQANWAFQYKPDEADEVWNKIPNGVDIVVTHTPPKGRCDGVTASGQQKDRREGCPALSRRIEQIRPMLNICGHIHSGRGVETVQWRRRSSSLQLHQQPTIMDSGTLVSSVQFWNDPGASNKKLSLVDLATMRARAAGRGSGCDHASLTRQLQPDSRCDHLRGQPDASFAPGQRGCQPPSGGGEKLITTASLTDVALRDSEALWGFGGGGRGGDAFEHHHESDTGHGCPDEATQRFAERQRGMPWSGTEVARSQTTVINAAYLGPRVAGKTSVAYNKPIVVDIELRVWGSWDEPSVAC